MSASGLRLVLRLLTRRVVGGVGGHTLMHRITVIIECTSCIIFAHLDPKIRPPPGFVYHLAVAEDPAQTTVGFFDAPQRWIEENGWTSNRSPPP